MRDTEDEDIGEKCTTVDEKSLSAVPENVELSQKFHVACLQTPYLELVRTSPIKRKLSDDPIPGCGFGLDVPHKLEPEDYTDNEDFEGGEIEPDNYMENESSIKKKNQFMLVTDVTTSLNCANCGDVLLEEKRSSNFHEFLPLDDLTNIHTGELMEVELIDAISEIFQLRRSEKYQELYDRQDLLLCTKCTSTLAQLYKLFHEFTSLTVASTGFLASVINLERTVAEEESLSLSHCEVSNSSEAEDEIEPQTDLPSPEAKRRRLSQRTVKLDLNRKKTSNKIEAPVAKKMATSKKVTRKQQSQSKKFKSEPKTKQSLTQQDKKKVKTTSEKNCSQPVPRIQAQEHSLPEDTCLECERCEKKFKTFGGLKIHQASHVRDDNKHVCKDCGKKFRKPEALEYHQKTDHGGFKPHQCPQCEKCFRLKDKLKLHVLVIHDKKKPFPCSKCEKSFRTKYHLKIHDVSQHIQGADGSVGCSQCKRKFSDMDSLKKHALVHEEEKPHQCKTCNKGFQTPGRLRLHEKSHQEVPSCLCPVCGRAYKHIRDLKLHEVSHQDESTYRFGCGDCSRKFYRIDLLRVHQSNEQHFSPEIVGPTITRTQLRRDVLFPNVKLSSSAPPEMPVEVEDDYEGEDENETDTEIEVPPPEDTPQKLQRKQKETSAKNRKITLSSLSRDSEITLMHPHATVIYHPSNVIQLQLNQQNILPGTSMKASSGTTLISSSAERVNEAQPTTATSYFITQRDRPNIVHHHPIQIQTSASGSHPHIQYGNQTIFTTNPINITNATGSTEQISFDFINSFMNNLG